MFLDARPRLRERNMLHARSSISESKSRQRLWLAIQTHRKKDRSWTPLIHYALSRKKWHEIMNLSQIASASLTWAVLHSLSQRLTSSILFRCPIFVELLVRKEFQLCRCPRLVTTIVFRPPKCVTLQARLRERICACCLRILIILVTANYHATLFIREPCERLPASYTCNNWYIKVAPVTLLESLLFATVLDDGICSLLAFILIASVVLSI